MKKLTNRRHALMRGFPTYKSTKPCPAGHLDERNTISGECVTCNLERKKNAHELYRAKRAELKEADK